LPGGAGLVVSVIPGSDMGGLAVKIPDLPEDIIQFGTCEGIIDGNKDFGLFRVKLDGKPENGGRKWRIKDNEFAYEWIYPQGIELKFSAKVEKEAILLEYTLKNSSKEVLNNLYYQQGTPETACKQFEKDFGQLTVAPKAAD
jgi:hypothetical protein